MNKLNLTYWVEGYKTITYDIEDSTYGEYIDYCNNKHVDANSKANLLRFLWDQGIEFTENLDITDETLDEQSSDLINFLKKANDIKRNQTEIPGNYSETE